MKRRIMFLFIVTLVTANTLVAQERRGQFRPGMMMGGTIRGRVIDEAFQTPIEYANIVIYSQRDSSQVTGTITDVEGKFIVAPVRSGNFYMDISFMG
jgi:hypothetical protein